MSCMPVEGNKIQSSTLETTEMREKNSNCVIVLAVAIIAAVGLVLLGLGIAGYLGAFSPLNQLQSIIVTSLGGVIFVASVISAIVYGCYQNRKKEEKASEYVSIWPDQESISVEERIAQMEAELRAQREDKTRRQQAEAAEQARLAAEAKAKQEMETQGQRDAEEARKQAEAQKTRTTKEIKKEAEAKKVKDALKGISDEKLMRIVQNNQLSNYSKSDLDLFEKRVSHFEEYKNDEKQQKEFGEHDTNQTIYLSFNSFGSKFGIFEPLLQEFITYLVMTERIYGYCKARVGYRLELHKPKKDLGFSLASEAFYTKQLLLAIDDGLEQINLPSPKAFVDKGKPLSQVEDILQKIRQSYYFRLANPTIAPSVVEISGCDANNPEDKEFLDHLVKNKVILAWNRSNRLSHRIYFKLTKADQTLDGIGTYPWRDLTYIENEENFRKQNQIEISPKQRTEMGLNDHIKALKDLVTKINGRTKHGVIQCIGFEYHKILEALVKHGHIKAYKRISTNDFFDVYVTQADYPTA